MPRIREYATLHCEDTANGPFLHRLEADLHRVRNVRGLPEELERAMLANLGRAEGFDEDIEGEVAL